MIIFTANLIKRFAVICLLSVHPISSAIGYLSLDDSWKSAQCKDVFMNLFAGKSDIKLEIGDYASAEAILITDEGFLPSWRIDQITPRVVTIDSEQSIQVKRKISTLVPKAIQEKAISDVYKNYPVSVKTELLNLVEEVEKGLPEENVSFGVISDKITKELKGMLRAYKAKQFTGENSDLPVQRMLKARGLSSPKLDALRFRSDLIELGSYFIFRGTPSERLQLRNLLFAWVSQIITPANRGVVFVAHVATEGHRKLYESLFGYEVLESVYDSKLNVTEYILIVKAEKLQKHYEAFISSSQLK